LGDRFFRLLGLLTYWSLLIKYHFWSLVNSRSMINDIVYPEPQSLKILVWNNMKTFPPLRWIPDNIFLNEGITKNVNTSKNSQFVQQTSCADGMFSLYLNSWCLHASFYLHFENNLINRNTANTFSQILMQKLSQCICTISSLSPYAIIS
jgi:hypothetical protein